MIETLTLRSSFLSRISREMRKAFTLTFPVLVGYLSLGTAFGYLAVHQGLDWYLAPLMSLVVYAGAAQFIAVPLIATGASLSEIALTTFVINLRHLFYGLSFLNKVPQRWGHKLYVIFGLTDETFSVLTSKSIRNDSQSLRTRITILNHCYWVMGSIIGALSSLSLQVNIKGLDFTLTALFVVLFIEQLNGTKAKFMAIGSVSALISFVFFPQQFLFSTLLLATFLLLAEQYYNSRT